MDISINERLKEFVELEKISSPEIYKKIGVHRSIWSGWMNQGKAISVEKLTALFRTLPNLNARWLLTGEGNMYCEENKDLIIQPNIKIRNKPESSFECESCKAKDNEIDALKIALEAKEELLEIYRSK